MTRPVAMPTLAASDGTVRLQLADRLGKLQSRAHRPLGVLLMRAWVAEIGEHAVAHILGDVPIPALDHFGAALVISSEHCAHVFWVEPRRQLGRTHQIAEQHCQLSALRIGLFCRRLRFLDRYIMHSWIP